MSQTSNQAGGRPGLINQNHAVGGMSVSPILSNRSDIRSLLRRIDLAEPMRRRAVQQAIRDALAETWLRPGRHVRVGPTATRGLSRPSTPAELAEADARCAMIAANCRAHARLLAEVEEDQ